MFRNIGFTKRLAFVPFFRGGHSVRQLKDRSKARPNPKSKFKKRKKK